MHATNSCTRAALCSRGRDIRACPACAPPQARCGGIEVRITAVTFCTSVYTVLGSYDISYEISDLADVFPNGEIKSAVLVECDKFGFMEGLRLAFASIASSCFAHPSFRFWTLAFLFSTQASVHAFTICWAPEAHGSIPVLPLFPSSLLPSVPLCPSYPSICLLLVLA